MTVITAVETYENYEFTVMIDLNKFVYNFGKIPPVGQLLNDYLQNCKRESGLLAQYEIDKNLPHTSISI